MCFHHPTGMGHTLIVTILISQQKVGHCMLFIILLEWSHLLQVSTKSLLPAKDTMVNKYLPLV